MGKTKIVTTKILDEPEKGALEEVEGEEVAVEVDQIAEILSTGAEIYTIFRVESMTGREVYVAKLRRPDLSWESLSRFGTGEYIIKALDHDGAIADKQVVKLDTTFRDVSRIAQSPLVQALPKSTGGGDDPALGALVNIVQQVVAKSLNDRQIVPQNNMPDMTAVMQSMGTAMAAGIQGAMGVMTTIMQEQMRVSIDSQKPKNIIDNLKDVLELAESIKGGGVSRGGDGMIEKIISKGVELLGPMIAGKLMQGMTPPPGYAPVMPVSNTPIPPTQEAAKPEPKVEAQPVQQAPVQPEAKPTFQQYLFYYTQSLLSKINKWRPYTGANVLFEDLDDDHIMSLAAWVNSTNAAEALYSLAPHTAAHKEWFGEFVTELKEIHAEWEREGEEEDEAAAMVNSARGRKNGTGSLN